MRQYDGSLGAILPKFMTDRLNLSAGDKVFVIETEHGILITPFDPDVAQVMEIEERVSTRYQNALHELAQ